MEIISIKAFFGVLSSVAVLLGYVPYLKDISRGKVHPHILSWTGWGFTTAIAAVAMISVGFTWGVAIVAANSVLCFTVAIYSILKKTGVWQTTIYDYMFFALGVVGIILWQTFNNPDLAISFSIFADLSFGIPTLIKICKNPKSETVLPWVFFAISGIASLFAVSYISYTEVAYPIYMAIYDSSALLLLILVPKFLSSNRQNRF